MTKRKKRAAKAKPAEPTNGNGTYLTAKQLAKRWNVNPDMLKRLRTNGRGPACFRPGGDRGKVVYSIVEIEKYERAQTSVAGSGE